MWRCPGQSQAKLRDVLSCGSPVVIRGHRVCNLVNQRRLLRKHVTFLRAWKTALDRSSTGLGVGMAT